MLGRLLLLSGVLWSAGAQLIVPHPAGPMPNIQELPVYGKQQQANRHGLSSSSADFNLPKDTLVEPLAPKPTVPLRVRAEEVVDGLLAKAQDPQTRLAWILSMMGCGAVVLCGILPVLFLPVETGAALHQGRGLRKLNLLLSFAVGSLLGDVFLHILPETWQETDCRHDVTVGLWIIIGLLGCFLVEKVCAKSEESQHTATAIMNLVANLIDNFMHGLAVAGSFSVSIRFGVVTTFAILVHEIPHEISDFAILLRADFNRMAAVKAQLLTAMGGIFGATIALLSNADAIGRASGWILPFTAGGFLNIALVQVLPDLIRESSNRESLKQLFFIFLGITVMGFVNTLHLA